jgi:hypothetical protein
MKTSKLLIACLAAVSITAFISQNVGSQELRSTRKMPLQEQVMPLINSGYLPLDKEVLSSTLSQPQYVPGEVIIKLKEAESTESLFTQKYSQRKVAHDARLSQLKAKYNLKDERPVFKGLHNQLKAKDISQNKALEKVKAKFPNKVKRAPKDAKTPDLFPIYVLKTNEDVLTACEKLKQDPDIEYAQPNYVYQLYAEPLPNEPYIPNDYYLEDDQNPGFWREGSWNKPIQTFGA